MRVEDILRVKGRAVQTVTSDTSVAMAVHRLAAREIGALIVSDDGTRLDGVFGEREVVRAMARRGSGVADLRVRDVMARDVPTCRPEDAILDVMGTMTRTRTRHLPVLDADGRLGGVISVGDVVKHRLDELELEMLVLRATGVRP